MSREDRPPDSPPPWYRRFLDNPPPMSDRTWALYLMALLVLFGLTLGYTLCLFQDRMRLPARPAFQQQLDHHEQRLRALEQR